MIGGRWIVGMLLNVLEMRWGGWRGDGWGVFWIKWVVNCWGEGRGEGREREREVLYKSRRDGLKGVEGGMEHV